MKGPQGERAPFRRIRELQTRGRPRECRGRVRLDVDLDELAAIVALRHGPRLHGAAAGRLPPGGSMPGNAIFDESDPCEVMAQACRHLLGRAGNHEPSPHGVGDRRPLDRTSVVIPLGVELLNNIKSEWWKTMTYREDVEGIDASILMHPRVWEASAHVENFTDPMVDCKECKARFRADQLEDAMCGNKAYQGRKALKCKEEGKFTEARQFNLMFKSFIGPVEDSGAVVYLRPETAQGIYVNFLNVQGS